MRDPTRHPALGDPDRIHVPPPGSPPLNEVIMELATMELPPPGTQAPPRIDVATTEDLFAQLQLRGWSGTLRRETDASRQEFEIGRFEPVNGAPS